MKYIVTIYTASYAYVEFTFAAAEEMEKFVRMVLDHKSGGKNDEDYKVQIAAVLDEEEE